MENEIKSVLKNLIENGQESNNVDWQSIKGTVHDSNPVIELHNVYIKFPSTKDLDYESGADLPWAENHFMERISRDPSNPGIEYKNWPYYQGEGDDKRFREKGQFSHTYQERFWSRDVDGLRFRHGDLNDMIYKLKLNPYTRQGFFPIYWPEDVSIVDERVPCTLGYWFYHEDGKLNMTYLIRSCDATRHFRNDIYMSYRLLEHVSDALLIDAGKMDMWIGSFHCFKSDIYTLKKQIK